MEISYFAHDVVVSKIHQSHYSTLDVFGKIVDVFDKIVDATKLITTTLIPSTCNVEKMGQKI